MLPIGDDNPTFRRPVVTLALIGLNVVAWVAVQGAGTHDALLRSTCELGAIPGEITGRATQRAIELAPGATCVLSEGRDGYTVLTSMFMHGGWFHLIGNMWFLWVFGNNVEDSMGRLRFVAFYQIGRAHV